MAIPKKKPDPDKVIQLFKTVKCFLKSSIVSNQNEMLQEINDYVLVISELGLRASKLINASLLFSIANNKFELFKFEELQTIMNHAMEFSGGDNKHIIAKKPFHSVMKETYEQSPIEWDALLPKHNLNRTILCQMKTVIANEFVTNTLTGMKKLPIRIATYIAAYWKIKNARMWTKCKKSVVKKAFMDGKFSTDVPWDMWLWIEKERALLNVAKEEYIGEMFISQNKHSVIRYLHHISQFWDEVKENKSVKWKGFTLFPMYTCNRLHITLDELFIFHKSGMEEKFKKECKEVKAIEKLNKTTVVKETSTIDSIQEKRKTRIKASLKPEAELNPKDRFRLLGQEHINEIWSTIFTVDKFETRNWKFAGVIKTDGVSVSYIYEKFVKQRDVSKEYKVTVEDLQDKRILSVDPGRNNMATVALIVKDANGIPITLKTWKLTRKGYYEKAGIVRENATKREWNKQWLNSTEFLAYAKSTFRTASFENFKSTLKLYIPVYALMWKEKQKTRYSVSAMQCYMGKRKTLDQFWNSTWETKEEHENTRVLYGACVRFMLCTGKNEMAVPIKPVLVACERVYEKKIKLVNEDYTSKKDCYTETDLKKLYCTKLERGAIHVLRVKKDIEVRGMRLCDSKGNSKIKEYRKTNCVDRDINACINIYKAGTSIERPVYLVKIRKTPKKNTCQLVDWLRDFNIF